MEELSKKLREDEIFNRFLDLIAQSQESPDSPGSCSTGSCTSSGECGSCQTGA